MRHAERGSAAGGAAALHGRTTGGPRADDELYGRGGPRVDGEPYGRAWTCGPTALDQTFPFRASQLVDQVMAPRMPG
ncbi:hypothetical protein GCM10018785_47170 [Streptomyces longispororuber]|uniref:Uncharacterized protein n=1 Tax=Streptomyces longispororuber TaxID=68230 RepID=A0A919DSR6_9ACTN|nr:hypothetical protein GCM10018785_47170 [Streptomyces longispororuber]